MLGEQLSHKLTAETLIRPPAKPGSWTVDIDCRDEGCQLSKAIAMRMVREILNDIDRFHPNRARGGMPAKSGWN